MGPLALDPRETYLRLMVCIARADGRVDQSEVRLIEAAAERSGLSEPQLVSLRAALDISNSFDVEQELGRAVDGMDPGTLLEVLRDGYVLALSDGELAPTEVETLERLLAKLGIRETDRASLHEWARLAAEHVIDGLYAAASALEHARSGNG